MFTIVASSTTISWAMPRTARIAQRRAWWGLASVEACHGGLRSGSGGGVSASFGSVARSGDIVSALRLPCATCPLGTAHRRRARCARTPSATASASSTPPASCSPSAAWASRSTTSPATRASASGTVYRRFPDKEQLIDALFEERLEAIVAIAAERARRSPTRGTASSPSSSAALELQAARPRAQGAGLHGTAHGRRARRRGARAARAAGRRARRRAPRRRARCAPTPPAGRAADPVDARRRHGPLARRRARALAALPDARPRRPAARAERGSRCAGAADEQLDRTMRAMPLRVAPAPPGPGAG